MFGLCLIFAQSLTLNVTVMIKQVMLSNKNLESNCKRIAKYIKVHSIDPEVVMSGKISMMASEALVDDFNDNKKDYLSLINHHMKGGKVLDGSIYTTGYWFLKFKLKFDE